MSADEGVSSDRSTSSQRAPNSAQHNDQSDWIRASAVCGAVCHSENLIRIGPDRFGLLALAWAAVGYMGMFDLGFSHLSRAIWLRL